MEEQVAGRYRGSASFRRVIAIAIGLALLATACSGGAEDAGPAEPTPTVIPGPPTATASPEPTIDSTPTPVDIPTATVTAVPSVTTEPTSTLTPTATVAPFPTSPPPTATASPPTATATPAATLTPTATPTPTATAGPVVSIGCRIRPARPVAPGEILIFTALQDPPSAPVTYVFDHGDGTLDPGPVSRAYYAAPGIFEVRLNWAHDGRSGTVLCGSVTVVDVGGGTPTPTPTPTPGALNISCTIEPDRTVLVGETLVFTAIQDPPSVPVSYVFDHGDGTLDPRPVSYAYYAAPGVYEVRLNWAATGVGGGTIICGTVTVSGTVTPTPTPTPTTTVLPVSIGCQIDPQRPVTVGEILVYSAFQNPPDLDVDYVFDHGDGTLDPGPVSWAYYASPGDYSVVLRWNYQGRVGTVFCGVVTVLG